MKHLLTLALILAPVPAMAADWRLASTGKDGMKAYIDVESVRQVGSWISAWQKREKANGSNVGLVYFNCATHETALKSLTNYDLSGRVTHTHTNVALIWDPVTPDTIGDDVFAFVCK